MGIGKSLQSLAAIELLGEKVKKTLIVAPLSVISSFENQIDQHTHLKSYTIPKGGKKALEGLKKNKDGDWDILLVHPENLINRSKGYQYWNEVTNILCSMTFDMVIIDEFHQLLIFPIFLL